MCQINKPKIYITRKLPNELIEDYKDYYDFRMWEESEPVPRDVLLQEVSDVEGLLCMISEEIDDSLLQSAPNLQVVANCAVGYDNIDVNATKKHKVIVTNTPDVLTDTTADLGFALLMATARKILEANQFIEKNEWKYWAPYLLAGTDVHHKTIGIVGMGRIGEAIAQRASGFDMNIIYHNRSRRIEAEKRLNATYVDFETLLREADFVVNVVPLTGETHHLFGYSAFEIMKTSAIFINISRGATVNEKALIQALKDNKIKAAGLDVFEQEPITNDHPLMQLDNCLCLPHIGSASMETRTKMIQLCLENIDGVLRGRGAKTPI